jgi:hypothetical protein
LTFCRLAACRPTLTRLIPNQEGQSRKANQDNGLRNPETSVGAEPGAVEPHPLPTDPDLSAVILAWPTLPEAVRVGIVAMVRASEGRPAE